MDTPANSALNAMARSLKLESCDLRKSLQAMSGMEFNHFKGVKESKSEPISANTEEFSKANMKCKDSKLRRSANREKDVQLMRMALENTMSIKMMQQSILQLTEQVSQIKGVIQPTKSPIVPPPQLKEPLILSPKPVSYTHLTLPTICSV
eukprot:TRINITY_DN12399_c0_g1_i1.p1 TRINITY_DN12399_c0_g1~~TRINITY_DN12399_c0_g1_i1.p1  ORF type:complete len:150 (+),score=34.55 TRINITY_DN12399_c0_g1_i1:441-890(+)